MPPMHLVQHMGSVCLLDCGKTRLCFSDFHASQLLSCLASKEPDASDWSTHIHKILHTHITANLYPHTQYRQYIHTKKVELLSDYCSALFSVSKNMPLEVLNPLKSSSEKKSTLS